MARAFAKSIGALFFETSAKTSKNIQELFIGIGNLFLERVYQIKQDSPAEEEERVDYFKKLNHNGGDNSEGGNCMGRCSSKPSS